MRTIDDVQKCEERIYRKNIRITSIMSSYFNCCCDLCFKTDYVIKVDIPRTKYHDGRHLTTFHKPMWICETCRDKLVKALSLPYPSKLQQDGDPHDSGQ